MQFIKPKIILGLLSILTFNLSFSQKVTKQIIDSAFKSIDTAFKQKRGVMYVLNGVPYDSLQLDTVLTQYDLKYLVELTFITCEKTGFFHCYNDAALILFAYNQKTKIKRKLWKTARQLLADEKNLPTLFIDNVAINAELTRQRFNALHLKDIMYVDTAQRNGTRQIRIWNTKVN